MRKIKFRGFTRDCIDNEWVYGDLIHYPKDKTYIIPQNGRCWEKPKNDYELPWDSKFHEVDKNSIGQHTGLKDRLSKEIYEGDILKFEKGDIMYVAWDNEYKGFVLIDPVGDEGSAGIGNWILENVEIIGNIFENKELLETRD